MKRTLALFALGLLCLAFAHEGFGQSLGNAGTIEGSVVDPSGAAVPKAVVTIHNAVTGYSQTATTASDGSFRFSNIPPNPYHLQVMAPGFDPFSQDVAIRNAVPMQIRATMAVAGSKTSLTVEAAGAEMIELDRSEERRVGKEG